MRAAFFRNHSIRWQLIAVGTAILLFMFAAGVWGYNEILNITFKRNSEYTTEILATIRQNISSNADSINRILPNIAYNEQVQEYLLEDDRLRQYEMYNKIEKLLVNLQSMKQGILGVVLVGRGTSSYNCVGCRDYIPFPEIPERTSSYYTGVQYSPYYKNYVLYVGVPVYDNRQTATVEQKIGYAVMALSLNAIVPSVDSVSSKISGSFYVLDRNLVIASSNDPKKLGEKPGPELETILLQGARSDSFRRDGEELIVHSEPIPGIGGRIVSVLPESELFQGLEEVQRLLLGMFVLLIAVMYVLYITITRNMLVPIQTFIAFIHKLRSAGLDHFHKRVPIEGYAEINILARQFNSLLDEIDDLTAKLVDSKTHIYELQLHKKQAELQYLKNQINPHFLYNTLETIKGIAYVKKVPEIRDMTDALSRVFRYSIKGEEEVQVRDELHIIKAYISIQQVRFGDRFDVRYEFPEPCLDVMILKMIMQPLVENAVFHGIEPSLERSVLTVGCRMENKRDLLLWVTDDGVGMEPAEREALTAGLEAANGEIPRAASQPHIGLRNVNNRIKYAYGPEYGIASIDSAPGRGTKVTVKVPAKGDSRVQSFAG
ncbi:sensor histidine kinase [Paenibacillus aurantius]|uniref:Sensor histidine kinase n=1 Tax=Paenibacillus aurantius TaxID=2918900 RepID=A0AA96LE32_9BACL|nr:sensor histidine kinase [Paenibacillus aurantius]WNQ12006.1 sensor histidine kinase [Paenibacillus aurantius]